ncbi:MAG: toxin-antitoxin system YwqK family antitoxin [Neisseriaceae bacterium]|nr:toxin-antitoxin system YwqK family antitoxin [Neisseriaceae bacterium]
MAYTAMTHVAFFDVAGRLIGSEAGAKYERRARLRQNEPIQIQDFYVPARQKYSNVYVLDSREQLTQFMPRISNGEVMFWYENGQPKMKGQYVKGRQEGEWRNWHPNGKLSAQLFYEGGKVSGRGARWYPSGGKESEMMFKQDLAEGPWLRWYENGQMRSNMKMVRNEVVEVQSWDEEGRQTLDMFYTKDGKRNGVQTEWFGNDQKSSELIFKDDEVIDRSFWDTKGNLINEDQGDLMYPEP